VYVWSTHFVNDTAVAVCETDAMITDHKPLYLGFQCFKTTCLFTLCRGGHRGGPPGRPAPYAPRREPYDAGASRRYEMPPAPAAPVAARREEFASDQVKDLLELYIRDPTAFDQYARSYYYGERAERRLAAAAAAVAPTNYYDSRPAATDRLSIILIYVVLLV